MKCKSCNEDVPPKFTHAISVNICPLCGQEIMSAKLQNILGELKIAFGDAKEYMSEIEDWLYSNYSFKKINEDQIVINKSELKKELNNPPIKVNRSEGDEIVLDEPRAQSVFERRAGIKNHKKNLDFIKGRSFGPAHPSEFKDDEAEWNDAEQQALQNNEDVDMNNLFDTDDSRTLELEKIKKIRSQNSGGGAFRR